MKRQAAYHGEIGANGRAYQKGQFIAEQVEYQGSVKKVKRSGKQEVAPYVWEIAPDSEARSIHRFICGSVYNIYTKEIASDETLAFLGFSKAQVESLVARYEDGEKWFYPNHEVYI